MALESIKKVDFTLRQATPSDADLLTALGKRCFIEAFSEVTAPADMAAYLKTTFNKEEMQYRLTDARALFLIVEMETEPAGYAFLYPTAIPDCIKDGAAIQLVRFYLLKKYYGRGAGNALMQACLQESRHRCYSLIWLSSWELNPRANAFYRKWHFKAVGRQKFTVGSDVQDDFIFSREIKP
jgi:GNAT superfamily N-acetyltransferase